jgi:hypothetical protein
MHHASEEERRAMGSASASLSRQFAPELWAKTLENGVGQLRSMIPSRER